MSHKYKNTSQENFSHLFYYGEALFFFQLTNECSDNNKMYSSTKVKKATKPKSTCTYNLSGLLNPLALSQASELNADWSKYWRAVDTRDSDLLASYLKERGANFSPSFCDKILLPKSTYAKQKGFKQATAIFFK